MTSRLRKKNQSTSTVSFFACKSLDQQNLRGNAEQHQWKWEQLIWTWYTVGFELEQTLDSRITLCVRPKPPSSSLYTIPKPLGARKFPRYNRFFVIYDLVITDICCVYLYTRPNYSTKFARYNRSRYIRFLLYLYSILGYTLKQHWGEGDSSLRSVRRKGAAYLEGVGDSQNKGVQNINY